MKVGILTQPLGLNYGGIMQNYALQQVLCKEGHEPVTLRVDDAYWEKRSLLRLYVSYLYLRLFKKGYPLPTLPVTNRRRFSVRRYTEQFIKKYIAQSQVLSSEELLHETNERGLDALIVGSDQTWRPSYSPNIADYFLDFLPNDSGVKRIAYASSFGTDDWEFTTEETVMARQNTKLFDAISVREESGVSLCQKYLGVSATFALDPTLLLTAEDYVSYLNLTQPPHGKVFAYLLDPSPEKEAFATRIAQEKGTTHFEMMPKMTVFDQWKEVSDYQLRPVEEWLESIRGAEFVVTDSFHGAVFSIIFGKPFVVIKNRARGTARFDTLMKFVSPDSFVNEEEMAYYQMTTPEVDREKLEVLKDSSLQFLRDTLRE